MPNPWMVCLVAVRFTVMPVEGGAPPAPEPALPVVPPAGLLLPPTAAPALPTGPAPPLPAVGEPTPAVAPLPAVPTVPLPAVGFVGLPAAPTEPPAPGAAPAVPPGCVLSLEQFARAIVRTTGPIDIWHTRPIRSHKKLAVRIAGRCARRYRRVKRQNKLRIHRPRQFRVSIPPRENWRFAPSGICTAPRHKRRGRRTNGTRKCLIFDGHRACRAAAKPSAARASSAHQLIHAPCPACHSKLRPRDTVRR